MKRSPSHSTTTPTRDKISPKNWSLLVHIAELSTPVVEVAIKITNASLIQNQCFQWVTTPLTRVLRDRDRATPLNWTMTVRSGWAMSTIKQNRIYQFFRKRFNQRWLQFLLAYSFSDWLAVSCFSFWKAFVKCPSLSVNGIFDDVRYDVIST